MARTRPPLHVRIRRLREAANISIKQLADEAGITASLMRSIEEGEVAVLAEVYDAARQRWSKELSGYPRPPVIERVPFSLHPAAVADRDRIWGLQRAAAIVQRFSPRNRALIKELVLEFKKGPYDANDLNFCAPD